MNINEMTPITPDQLKKLIMHIGNAQQYQVETTWIENDVPARDVCTGGEILAIKAGSAEVCDVDPYDGTIWTWDKESKKSVILVAPETAEDIRVKGSILVVDGQAYAIVRTSAVNIEDIAQEL